MLRFAAAFAVRPDGKGYAFTEHGEFGEVYQYRFSTGELKSPLKQAVTDSGWIYRGVTFGKL